MKIELEADDSFMSHAPCPLCNKETDLEFGDDFTRLSRYYKNMDFTAVARNSAMADGLGDTLFISGSGGSIQYGQISDRISSDLGFHRPVSLAWRSGDFYLGMTHRAALHELARQFSLNPSDFLDTGLPQKIERAFEQISDVTGNVESHSTQKNPKARSGRAGNAKNQVLFAQKIFSLTPSFLDILANQDAESILQAWNTALSQAEIRNERDTFLMNKDIIYPAHLLSDVLPDELSALFRNIRNIGV
jgi:hypothetical protein